MLVNINPGCLFGGSATEYFIGNFDGKKFTADTAPNTVKWLDYGKDHYASQCPKKVPQARKHILPYLIHGLSSNKRLM